MQALPGGRGEVRQGLQLEDDRRGEELQGAEAGSGAMPIVREVVGKDVTGDAPPNPARRGKRGVGS